MSIEDARVLSDKLLDRFKCLVEDVDAQRTSRNLRRVFFDYLRFQQGTMDTDFEEILDDIDSLISLMDAIADETKSRRGKVT